MGKNHVPIHFASVNKTAQLLCSTINGFKLKSTGFCEPRIHSPRRVYPLRSNLAIISPTWPQERTHPTSVAEPTAKRADEGRFTYQTPLDAIRLDHDVALLGHGCLSLVKAWEDFQD